MSSATLAPLGKNQVVSLDVVGRICQALSCDVRDFVTYVREEE